MIDQAEPDSNPHYYRWQRVSSRSDHSPPFGTDSAGQRWRRGFRLIQRTHYGE
jgi:hypothetical protein